MRRNMALVVVGLVGLWLAWFGGGKMSGSVPLAVAADPAQQPPGLGMRFAGVWFFDLFVGSSSTPTPLIVNMNADGTSLTSNSPMADGGTCSTVHGAWRCVEPNKAIATFICIVYGPDGQRAYYEKGSYDIVLSDDGDRLEKTAMSIGIYAPSQDPLTEEPAWGVVPCSYAARRLKIE